MIWAIMVQKSTQLDPGNILYGAAGDRYVQPASLDNHPIIPSKLKLVDGVMMGHDIFENVEGFSGSSDWAVEASSLPEEWTSGSHHRYDSRQSELTLTIFSLHNGGLSAELIDPEPVSISYAAGWVKVNHAGKHYRAVADQAVAVFRALDIDSGRWYWLEQPDYPEREKTAHYLAYAVPGADDFRRRVRGLIRLHQDRSATFDHLSD